jgi:hypothetical protein
LILRVVAIVVWVVAAVFVNFIEPSLQPASLQTLLEKRESVTVQAKVVEAPKKDNGFAGQEKFSVKIEVQSDGPLATRIGSLSGDSGVPAHFAPLSTTCRHYRNQRVGVSTVCA